MPEWDQVKAEELHTLDGEELSSRLKGARRELYELRFKLAVGQLDDHRQIRKVRKDIARILTVVHARRLALVPGDEFQDTETLPRAVGGVPGEAGGGGEPEAAVEVSEPASDVLAESPSNPPHEAGFAGTPGEETPEDVETATEGEPGPPARRSRRRPAAGEEGNHD
jgi:large subunit ribosomal protein L29